jgi:uncharacterized membrane protein
MRRHLVAWLPMVALAVLNGALREYGYGPALGDPAAHQLSTLILILLFAGYVWLLDARWPVRSGLDAARRGAVWLVLTVAFELGMGLLSGLTLGQLLSAYDILGGSLWLLVPLSVAVLPPLVYGIRRRRSADERAVLPE